MIRTRAFAEQALTAIPMPSSRAMSAAWDPANRAIRKVMRRVRDAIAAELDGTSLAQAVADGKVPQAAA